MGKVTREAVPLVQDTIIPRSGVTGVATRVNEELQSTAVLFVHAFGSEEMLGYQLTFDILTLKP